ncbi:hypothetical protein RLOatenuis_8350 [Rickettsiales bacterium]|nr:hypothetical protein RLOatenuis_8350 [Rickettsiales bacterium]
MAEEKSKPAIPIFKICLFIFSLFNLACIVMIFCYLLIISPKQQTQIASDLLNSSFLADKFQSLESRVETLKQDTLDEAKSMISKMQDDAVGIFLEKVRKFKSDREAYLDKALLALYNIKKRLYQGISYNDLLFNIKNYYDSDANEKTQNALILLSKHSHSGVSSFYELQRKLPSILAENKVGNAILSEFISVENKESLVSEEVLARLRELVLLSELDSAIDAINNLPQQHFFTSWLKEAKTVAAVHCALDEIFKDLKDEVMRGD